MSLDSKGLHHCLTQIYLSFTFLIFPGELIISCEPWYLFFSISAKRFRFLLLLLQSALPRLEVWGGVASHISARRCHIQDIKDSGIWRRDVEKHDNLPTSSHFERLWGWIFSWENHASAFYRQMCVRVCLCILVNRCWRNEIYFYFGDPSHRRLNYVE